MSVGGRKALVTFKRTKYTCSVSYTWEKAWGTFNWTKYGCSLAYACTIDSSRRVGWPMGISRQRGGAHMLAYHNPGLHMSSLRSTVNADQRTEE